MDPTRKRAPARSSGHGRTARTVALPAGRAARQTPAPVASVLAGQRKPPGAQGQLLQAELA